MHGNLAVTELNNLLDDGEPEAKAIIVELGSPLKFTELAEQLGQVFLVDATARILNMHRDHPVLKASRYRDAAISREFEGILYQIDENLLESLLVAKKEVG